MSCVPHATRAVPSSRSCTLASAANRVAIHAHPAIPQPSVNPLLFIEPTSGLRFDQPNFSAPRSRHSRKWRDQPLIDLWFVKDAEPNGIDLQLIGQFIHRRLGRVKSRHGAWAAHVGWCADVAPGASELYSKVRHAVMKRGRFTAILVIVLEH